MLGGAVMVCAAPLAAQRDEAQKAKALIIGLDISSADLVEWCSSRVPATAGPLRAAWQAWRTANAVDDITRSTNAAMVERTRSGMAPVLAKTRERMAAAGDPAAACAQVRGLWASSEFDVRRTYAIAYDGQPDSAVPAEAATVAPPRSAAVTPLPDGAPAGSNDAPRPRGAFDAKNYAAVGRPTGTVYSVAQMTALRKEWVGTPYNFDRANRAMRAAGTLYIRGTVTTRSERFYLESVDGAFTSTMTVAPGIGLGAFLGQDITLEGTLEDLPNSLIFLRNTKVVRDPSALRASSLPAEPGMRRTTVPVAQIAASPGNGASPRDLLGMHYHWSTGTGVSGYEFREEIRLLFRDGTAYLRTDLAPPDLNVSASRRLEPQRWARWRRAGSEYEFQAQDDHGAPSGAWFKKSGRIVSNWPANQKLSGTFASSAFHGSIALGGVYSSTSVSFTPDGRWERVGFARGSSGSMAAQQPVGFNASASSVSDGSGTKSSAGGGNSAVYTRSESSRDDGAKNRGTYTLDGMTLELRADDGTVTRVICLPMDAERKSIFLFGRSFSRK
jgi:hypothetical protein